MYDGEILAVSALAEAVPLFESVEVTHGHVVGGNVSDFQAAYELGKLFEIPCKASWKIDDLLSSPFRFSDPKFSQFFEVLGWKVAP